MAETRWLGRAGAVAEVNTITIGGTWLTGETVTITINGKDLVITIGSLTTTAQVATTIKQAWEAETFTDSTATVRPAGGGPAFTEHSEITATASASVVTLTGDTAGVPWNVANFAEPEVANDTAQGGTASTIQLAASETFADDALIGHIVAIIGGTGAGQWRFIDDYTGATDTADVTPNWDTNPDGTSVYSVRKSGISISTNSASGTVVLAPSVRATGPNHYDDADNWSNGAVPAATDNVWLDNSAVSILYGMLQFGKTLTSYNQSLTYTGDVGLPKTNDPSGYPEFRLTALSIHATNVKFYGAGSGSGRTVIDSGSVVTTITIDGTGSPAEDGLGAFIWKGTGANTLRAQSGSISVAPFNGDVATISTLSTGAATVDIGAGVTLTTIDVESGDVVSRSNLPTLTMDGGTVTVLDDSTTTTITINGGLVRWASTGNLGTVVVGGPSGATLDFAPNRVGKLVTGTCTLKAGGQIIDPARVVTFNNDIARGSDVREISAR